mmetsp:Transcript_16238/g.61868  ORF Transcript_16238/g.61868 Transcript_16238/m.61868 type:complete len:82 (+) Transcript_16238:291-536(+)
MLSFLYKPQEDINYDFVAGAYLFASLVAVALYSMENFFDVKQVEGFYLIFAPFLPCLVWGLVMRSVWHAERRQKAKADKAD